MKLEIVHDSPECRLGLPFFYYCQCGSQASKECFEQAKRSSDGLAKNLLLWSLLKFKMLLRLFEKKSIRRGETVRNNLPQCGVFHGLSVIFTTWWDFQLKGVRIYISRYPKTSQNTWRKRIFFRKTRRWEKVFSEEDPKVRESFFWGRPEGTT